jgi:flagellar basal-body rod protein FlgB
VRTSAAHLEPVRRTQTERDRPDIERYETAPSGNAVVLEDQMMRVSETQTDYRMATTLYRKHIAMLKAAIGRNS